MDTKESMLLEFRIMVYSFGGGGNSDWQGAQEGFMGTSDVLYIDPDANYEGQSSWQKFIICTLMVCEFFSKHL